MKAKWFFFPMTSIGMLVAFMLGMREVNDRPDFTVTDAWVTREGLLATVQVNVSNETDVVLCPTVQLAARNRGGLDLEKHTGEPADGDGRINPGQTVGFIAVFTEMTEKDYERLDDFFGFVSDSLEC